LKEILEIQKRIDYSEIEDTLCNLANCLLELNKLEESEKFIRENIEIIKFKYKNNIPI
jgi:hypothetical protein